MVANTSSKPPDKYRAKTEAVERLRISACKFVFACRNIDCRFALTGSPGFIILLVSMLVIQLLAFNFRVLVRDVIGVMKQLNKH